MEKKHEFTASDLQELKESIIVRIPDTAEFVKYFNGFVFHVEGIYEKYNSVLSKMGIDGVHEIVQTYFGIYTDSLDNIGDFIENLQSNILEGLDLSKFSSEKELMEVLSKRVPTEKMIPMVGKLVEGAKASQGDKMKAMDAKVNLLNKEDSEIYEYFFLFIMRLWASYIVTNRFADTNPMLQGLLKQTLVKYYERVNSLYDKEFIPEKLILYIKGIEIPDEEKYLQNTEQVEDAEAVVVPPETDSIDKSALVTKAVSRLHFEDRSGVDFERLVHAFVRRQKNWDSLEWLGETGKDGGRDIWGEIAGQTFCYQCANYRKLTLKKGLEDITKLKTDKNVPHNFILVCGGTITVHQRKKIKDHAFFIGIKNAEILSGVEFEEKLRHETPDLIKRFFHGETFPDSPDELKKIVETVAPSDDVKIIDRLVECFDRPAFTTQFRQEVSIPNFEKALDDTIEVLNTGIHRLRDGIIIKRIPSRHEISDPDLKSRMKSIVALVVKLRGTFHELKKKEEIKPCGCDKQDCPVFFLSDLACETMDRQREDIFSSIRELKTDFDLKVGS